MKCQKNTLMKNLKPITEESILPEAKKLDANKEIVIPCK